MPEFITALHNLYEFLSDRDLLKDLDEEPREILETINTYLTAEDDRGNIIITLSDRETFDEGGFLAFVTDEEMDKIVDLCSAELVIDQDRRWLPIGITE